MPRLRQAHRAVSSAECRPRRPPRLFLRGRQFFQRLFRRSRNDFAGGLEARAVAGAIPRALGVVPADDAFQVSADGRTECDLTLIIAIRGNFLPLEVEDLALALLQRAK